MRKRRLLAVLLALSLAVSGNGMTVLAAGQDPAQETTGKEKTVSTASGNDVTDSEKGTVSGNDTLPADPTKPDTEEPKDETGEDKKPEETGTPEETGKPEEGGEIPDDSRDVTFTDDTGMKVTYDANAAMKYIYVVENGVLTAVRTKTTDAEGKEVSAAVAFQGNVELRQPEEGEKYTSIAKSVFSGNQDVTYVKLPAGVETIAAEAFKGCTALKGVYLPAGVNKIENSAFENCTAMTQISLPKAVTSIGDNAFRGDAKLYLVNMKDADYSELRTIGANAFAGCSVLSQFCSHSAFSFPVKLESIGEAAFQDCKAIGKIDFSANKKLSTIGAHCFAGCTGLAELTPGKTLGEIPEGAFAGCTGLTYINFENGANMTIGREAFKGCYRLKQLTLPQSVIGIGDYAFQGCTKLKQVEIKSFKITIGVNAFPHDAEDLVIVAEKDSDGYLYALENGLKTPDAKAYYQYTVEDVDGVLMSNGAFPGGKLWVGTGTQTEEKENINTLNQKKGVRSGELCYIYYSQSEEQKKNFTFITASLRCNGKTLQKKDGKYYFEMPVGGAVITAEFRANTPDTIKGQKVTVEFSNGTPLENGLTDEYGYLGVELRVGQTTRLFLLDEDGSPIPAAKLTSVKSDNEKVAKIDQNGVITAVGTEDKERADATVTVQVKGGDGSKITIKRTVSVTTAKAESIILKASDYSSLVKIDGEADGIQTASIKKNVVRAEALSFKLKANVYDGEEGISKKLTWTSSDTRVAALKSDKTTADDPVNVVTVPKNCEGEATITVTAQNPSGSEKEKITQKFVVRVYEEGYRLTSSKVTVNPRMTTGGLVELISAYGTELENAAIELYEEKSLTTTPKFTAVYDDAASSAVCKKFQIRAVSSAIESGTYKVRVGVNGDKNEKNLMPLTITVEKTKPSPKVEFNVKKAEFNLFYVNGGTTDKGEQISVLTKITELNDAKVRKVALEALSEKEDDRLFTQNFVIDEADSDLAKGNVVIKRSGEYLRYTSKKKAALTGYLVIYYEGYEDTASKKVKVTMPTVTKAPEWALETEQSVYRAGLTSEQEVKLVVYDKASKKKEQVVLGEGYTVTETKGQIALDKEGPKIVDGAIAMKFWPDNGTMEFVLRNSGWDKNKNGNERTMKFTYKVKVSNAKPTVKTDKSSISLNVNYPESVAEFKLVSTPSGLQIDPNQTFTPVVTKSNASEIARLWVTYENGEGKVGIKSGQTVKKGTYKFECTPSTEEHGIKKMVLTVKVTDSKPTVKLGKGSLQLNKAVYDNNAAMNNKTENIDASAENSTRAAGAILYREMSEVTFQVTGKPEGYTLASVGNGSQETSVVCTTRNSDGAEKYFTFSVEEDQENEKNNLLRVTLKDKNLKTGTYKFKMTPRYLKEGVSTVSAKPVSFNVKVISTDDIHMTVKTKGKLNLLNREGEMSSKNGIVYTPALKNIVGEIEDVKIYDASSLEQESQYFDISMIDEGKDKGRFFVTPKKIVKESQDPDAPIEYTYAELMNDKSYAVRIWVKVKGYAGDAKTKGGVLSKTLRIKTEQILPKVTLDKKKLDVYLSTKNYDASFIVKPKKGSVGTVEAVYFGEKDELANDSFTLVQTPQEDGSLKVTVHLNDAVGIASGTNANIKFYVKYKGQGTNTSEKATSFTMKIKVN